MQNNKNIQSTVLDLKKTLLFTQTEQEEVVQLLDQNVQNLRNLQRIESSVFNPVQKVRGQSHEDSGILDSLKYTQQEIIDDKKDSQKSIIPNSNAFILTNIKSKKNLSDEIDDSLVVDFSLKKFNSLQFSLKKKLTLLIQYIFPYITQSICVPMFYLLFGMFFKIKITGKEHIKDLKGPTLIISNHIAFYDAFLFDLFSSPFSNIFPFRFMGTRTFSIPFLTFLKKIGVVDIIYLLFGVFKVTPGEGVEKSLKKAYEILKHGGTVAMYPEGKIWKPTVNNIEPIGKFKWGAAILALNTNVKIIPISIKKTYIKGKFRSQININIGNVFYADQTKKQEEITKHMRDIILDLHNH